MAGTQISLKALEDYVFLNGTYTLTSQTALQKLFNATTNGAFTVESNTSYFFECVFDLTTMSATSGTFGFGFLGTATLINIKYNSRAQKSAAIGVPATSQTLVSNVITATPLVAASTITTGSAVVRGVIRINAGGTLIPSVNLSVAAAAVVGINSYFRIVPIGTNSQTNVGTWT